MNSEIQAVLDGKKQWCVINADCLDILPTLPDKCVDLVLTDPPYGIGSVWKGGFSEKHGWGGSKAESFKRNEWDERPPTKGTLDTLRKISGNMIVWGGNYFELPPSRCWLVWNKPERGFTLAEAELAWTNFDKVGRVFDGNRHVNGERVHPTQKPTALMCWCIENYSKKGDIILDPFLGSGTTIVAAQRLGRRCIGIELDKDYCKLAINRIENDMPLFTRQESFTKGNG